MIAETATVTVLLHWLHAHFFFLLDSCYCGDPATAMPTMTSGREGDKVGEREKGDLWKLACSVTESLCLKSSTYKHSYFILTQDSLPEILLNSVCLKRLVDTHLYWLMQQAAQVEMTTVNAVIRVAV